MLADPKSGQWTAAPQRRAVADATGGSIGLQSEQGDGSGSPTHQSDLIALYEEIGVFLQCVLAWTID